MFIFITLPEMRVYAVSICGIVMMLNKWKRQADLERAAEEANATAKDE